MKPLISKTPIVYVLLCLVIFIIPASAAITESAYSPTYANATNYTHIKLTSNRAHDASYDSGTWTVPSGITSLDVFVVGAGSAGTYPSGGGGGYTTTNTSVPVYAGQIIQIRIGAGSWGGTYLTGSNPGGNSQFGGTTANGAGSAGANGANGGSGGGAGNYNVAGVAGGSDGSSPVDGDNNSGDGQGTTTREFQEPDGALYSGAGGGGGHNAGAGAGGSGGGGAGCGTSGCTATAGTDGLGGGGGGTYWTTSTSADGGNGVIVIRHAVTTDTTPPASITALTNMTISCNATDWSWSNPLDADFYQVITYKNGALFENLSNSTTTRSWTGLSEGTIYTISTHTKDLLNNVNSTWVNASVQTQTCSLPVSPVLLGVKNLYSLLAGAKSIRWQWTNPSSSDFNGTEVWLNGQYFGIVPNYSAFQLMLNLSEGQWYTLGARTFNFTMAYNVTWLNLTTSTAVMTSNGSGPAPTPTPTAVPAAAGPVVNPISDDIGDFLQYLFGWLFL